MRCISITSKINLETAGGSVVDLHLKAKCLVDRGHEVTVVTAWSSHNRLPKSLPYKVALEEIGSGEQLVIQRCIYRILKKYESQADVFYIDGHIFCYGAGAYRLFGGKIPVVAFFNIKQVSWYDHNPRFASFSFARKLKAYARYALERILGAHLANRLDAFIFTVPTVAALYEQHGFDKRKSHVLLDFAEGGVTSAAPSLHTYETGRPITFFSSGRMIPEKGFDLLIRAFAELPRTMNATLTISGDGPESHKLKKLVEELNISDKVRFPGWVARAELYRLMDESDVFILPRWIIEYSSVLLEEAMLRGLPAIVPKGGGLEWILQGGGITFIDGNASDLARAMAEITADAETLREHAKKSAERAKDFEYSALGEKFNSVIENVQKECQAVR